MTYDNFVFMVWLIDHWIWIGCEIRYEWMYQDYYYEKQKLDSIR